MFLKTLTIKGFKSFADAATLGLEPGVTVVVGPNGSGKSNVVDAIGWVLGAQAPSAVRSAKMDDVIFAGTSGRAALGRAEVSLTLDNSSGQLAIEFSEVTITRRLFRSGDSEYLINNSPCRLLDVQELLSDSGVGRSQHVIISQGQIDAVLNARPEDRRQVIEEAAGILKYRKRKERSERRLAATEENLTRLADLTKEVRRQLKPLERQAEAARRYEAMAAELQALRLHLAGRELAGLEARLGGIVGTRRDLAGQDEELLGRLSGLDADIATAEAELADAGGDDVRDALSRAERVRERAQGVLAVLAERRRSLERDRNATVDAGVVANLEAEAARLVAERDAVDTELAGLEPVRAELDAELEGLDELRAEMHDAHAADPHTTDDAEHDGPTEDPAAAAAEVRRELSGLAATAERGGRELERLRRQLTDAEARATRLVADRARLVESAEAAETAQDPLDDAVQDAEGRREEAELALERADEAARTAAAASSSWSARAEALAMALDAARARAGAERLDELDGVLGTLLDVIEVDPGWEQAVEAAVGEALGAVVTDGAETARRAIELLVEGDLGGAVLVPVGASAPEPPPVGEPVADHVRARRDDLAPLLRTLIGGAVAVDGDWRAAADAALAHPASVIVTRNGDRFGSTGWRIGASGAGATGAALEEAEAAATEADAEAVVTAEALARARTELDAARKAEQVAIRAADENASTAAQARSGLERLDGDLAEARAAQESIEAQIAGLTDESGGEHERIAELEARLPALEAAAAEAREVEAARNRARQDLERQAADLRTRVREHELRVEALGARRQRAEARLGELDERLADAVVEREAAAERRVRLERQVTACGRLAERTQQAITELRGYLEVLRRRQHALSEEARRISERLTQLRSERTGLEKQLAAVRERSSRTELEETELRVRIETATESIRRDLQVEPDEAKASTLPELPAATSAENRVRELDRELRMMGPVNPLAAEEFSALTERHEFLMSQVEDVRSTRRELAKVIRAIDKEILETFAAAYADVAANFEHLVTTLFPGGKGGLKLTDPDDLLATGIEIEARPQGKNVRKLSLLSGGERSLVALAYLFAVFRSRPSPFYVMDEVEAALDDVNLHRFLDLLDEFRRDAQLLVVSHQKRTMEAADCLVGVTMKPGGSSQVVLEKVGAGAG
ncbi:MAG: chromosome segregation protein SMC [Actinomycetota bacterium]|nr:chromosome segregation protein SMC [Actinomycetota bacterium]